MNPNLVDMKEMKNRMIHQFVSQSNHLGPSSTIPPTMTAPLDSANSIQQINYNSYPTPAALMAAITAAALNASSNIPINNSYSLLNNISNKTQDRSDHVSKTNDTDNFEEDDENHLIKKSDHEYTHDTPPRSSSQSSIINSSPSSASKKKGLSDIINKLNKQSKDSSPSDQNSEKNENSNKDLDSNDDSSILKSRTCTSNSLTSNYNTNSIGCSDTMSNASSSSIGGGGASNSNCIVSNDYAMTAAEQISHLINVVATQNLSPPLSNVSNLDSNSGLLMNTNNDAKSNKSQMGLFSLLERANLIQYMNNFIEQGGDDLNQLLEADEEELKEICDLVGMSSKPLHVKRLRKAIEELKSQKNASHYNLTTPKSLSSSSSTSSSTTSSTASSFSISNLCSSSRNDSTSKQLPNINNQPMYPFYQYLPNNNDRNESPYSNGFVNNSMAATTTFNHLNMFQKFNASPANLLANNPSLSLLNNKLISSKKIQDENENSTDKGCNRDEDFNNQDEETETEKEDDFDEDENEDHEYDDTYDGEETDDIDVGKNLNSSENMSRQASIKMEQNEKMIKKNKVIELYTKGERCVRKLSQLTGVPLTTVYRVIGKLKGINYNIPRGNGAGRKTILDGQDREILVEILNAQPRISRKALGKELEKRTGKSIHNSTLNRELCRLRHHGHNFAATLAAANSATSNSNENDSYDDSSNTNIKQESSNKTSNTQQNNTNYLKHFNNRKSQSNLSISNENNQKKSDQIILDNEYIKLITNEAKVFSNQLAQSDIECKSVNNMHPDLSKQIIEICQMSTTHLSSSNSSIVLQARLEKIKQVVNTLIKENYEYQDSLTNESNNSFYDLCLNEACVQICLLKPTLLTRPEDLIIYGKRILENCQIVEENPKSSITKLQTKRSATPNIDQSMSNSSNKRIKLESINELMIPSTSSQIEPNQFNQALMNAFALHLQNKHQ